MSFKTVGGFKDDVKPVVDLISRTFLAIISLNLLKRSFNTFQPKSKVGISAWDSVFPTIGLRIFFPVLWEFLD